MKETTKAQYRLIQDRYIKVTWTHKIQECQGDIFYQKAKIVKNHISWFSVLTTGSALADILPWFPDVEIIGTITAVLALFLSYFTIRYSDGELEKKASENKKFAAEVHDLRNKYESLLADIKADILTDNEIVCRRNELREAEHILYENAPYTSNEAVKEAGIHLKIKKDSTTEQDEIDTIIPDYLK